MTLLQKINPVSIPPFGFDNFPLVVADLWPRYLQKVECAGSTALGTGAREEIYRNGCDVCLLLIFPFISFCFLDNDLPCWYIYLFRKRVANCKLWVNISLLLQPSEFLYAVWMKPEICFDPHWVPTLSPKENTIFSLKFFFFLFFFKWTTLSWASTNSTMSIC